MSSIRFITGLLLTGTVLAQAQLPSGLIDTQNPADHPLTPLEALNRIQVPEGFQVTLFAGDPDVAQPIAIEYDDRGRLWVAESFSYIEWKRKGQDRILIFEDTDGDGRFDKRTPFWEKGNHISGFQIGYGGVWVCDAPELLFIPDANRDDRPDAAPQVVLDGWSTEAEHNFFNGLTWGPDGWLYGRHGIKKPSLVGRPGTPNDQRIPLSCSIWRYHPTRKEFQVYAEGTINSWGLDWNEDGQAFITTSVIDHLWHLVAGAQFERWPGSDSIPSRPHAYGLMGPASDHRHWIGGQTERRTEGLHGDAGGGHSHSGLMIYQSDVWPEAYRNKAFFSNVLGQRINRDQLVRQGSTYAARHEPDFLLGNNEWFRAVDVKQGPHGEVTVAEWTDLGECHDRDGIHRTSGRLFQVQYGKARPSPSPAFDVSRMETGELFQLLKHENVWWRRHALRNLQERAAEGTTLPNALVASLERTAIQLPVKDAVTAVQTIFSLAKEPVSRLRDIQEQLLQPGLLEPMAPVRAQVIALLMTARTQDASDAAWLARMIPRETSPLVHLWMASALQYLPLESGWDAVAALAAAPLSETDRNLQLLRWYGTERWVPREPLRSMEIALTSDQHPWLSQSLARRVVEAGDLGQVSALLRRGSKLPGTPFVLQGLLKALPAHAKPPTDWQTIQAQMLTDSREEVKHFTRLLAHRFGDRHIGDHMLASILAREGSAEERRESFGLLLDSRHPGLAEALIRMSRDPDLGTQAVAAMAAFPSSQFQSWLLEKVRQTATDPGLQSVTLETLASRKDYAEALVTTYLQEDWKSNRIPVHLAHKLASTTSKGTEFAAAYGLNPVEVGERNNVLERWKKRFPESYLKDAKAREGRIVFTRVCGGCHRMYGEGETLGPDLTGSNRANLDYLLRNVLFPSEDVSEPLRMVTLNLRDGRSLSGLIAEETGAHVVLRNIGSSQKIQKSLIQQREVSSLSLMPEGLLDHLKKEDVRDLIGFLRTRSPQEAL